MSPRTRSSLLLALVAAAALVGCGGGGGDDDMPASGTTAALSTEEAASLAQMREEERLAHDVYATSAAMWGATVFAAIADSESQHTEAVRRLLQTYSQPDPMADRPTGVFATPAFQALYDTLTARSATTRVEALTVGAEIEELDLRDLADSIAQVQHTDIAKVYTSLARGSRNHLRAYVQALAEQGVAYAPKILAQAEYDAIVNSPVETGP